MIRNYIVGLLVVAFASLTGVGFSQYSIGGGISSFHGLNLPINRYGINVFAEIPRSNENTLLVRAVYLFPNKDIRTEAVSGKPGVTPSMVDADLVAKTSYFAIDGGTRHYILDDYDVGFSLFGGGHIKGILASYRASYRLPNNLDIDDYETSSYPPQPLNSFQPQYSLLFAFGGTVGAKYQLPVRGALTFDFGLEIITRLVDPYLILGNDISQLSFSFNLAYRYDYY